MNWKVDDLLYCMMLYFAEYDSMGNLFLVKKKYNDNKQLLCSICDVKGAALKDKLNKLISGGLVFESEIKYGGRTVPCFCFPYNEKEHFQMVVAKMLYYLAVVGNKNLIKVYVYLLDGYQWKLRENAEFTFTAKDIMIALGYSPSINSEVCKQIYCLLDALVKLGFVRYRDEWQHEPNSKISATKRLVLEFVARNMAEVGIDFV